MMRQMRQRQAAEILQNLEYEDYWPFYIIKYKVRN